MDWDALGPAQGRPKLGDMASRERGRPVGSLPAVRGGPRSGRQGCSAGNSSKFFETAKNDQAEIEFFKTTK